MNGSLSKRATRAAEPTARDVMRADVLVFDAATTVPDVWDAMRRAGTDHAVVMHRGTCAGVVELGEICLGRFLELAPVSRCVLPLALAVPSVTPDAGFRTVCRLLLASPAGAVVVLDDGGGVHGLVTLREIVAVVASAEAPAMKEAPHAVRR